VDVLEFVTAQLPHAPSRVLEVGCGDGRLARALDDLAYRVVAIDPAAPEGAIFQAVSLEAFDDPGPFESIIATSRRLAGISRNAGRPTRARRVP
jgi:SAM-dependent methyltransferase